MDELLDAAVGFAREMLVDRGAFYPFGATVLAEGDVAMSTVDAGLGDAPESAGVIEALTESFREQAAHGDIRACAICCDVRLEEHASGLDDAILITIEHRDAGAVHVFLPYRLGDDRDLSYGELSALRAESAIFRP